MGIVSNSFKHGLPNSATTIDGAAVVQGKGKVWYINAQQSGTGGSGEAWSTAFSTWAQAAVSLASGDTVFLSGKLLEQVVTPVNVFDVSVIGIGNRPRHADSAPVGGNLGTAQWGPPASGAVSGQATVRVLQQGWRFENILFTMQSSTAAAIELVRNAGAGDLERDASHAVIRGNRFAGAGVGIRFGVAALFTEMCADVLIEKNEFESNTTAILATSGFTANQHIIQDNIFLLNTNDISGPFFKARILRNVMSLAPTICIGLTGGSNNQIHGNYLPGTYTTSTLYNDVTGDNWNGNYASTGVTAAVP